MPGENLSGLNNAPRRPRRTPHLHGDSSASFRRRFRQNARPSLLVNNPAVGRPLRSCGDEPGAMLLFPSFAPMDTFRPSSDLLEAAEQYAALGLPIIPLRGKIPAVQGWQRFFADAVNIHLWFGERRCNIGLRTGESGYVVVDTDTDEAEQWVRDHLTTTPLAARSGGGSSHRYYQTPARKEIRNRQGWNGIHGLDVRGQGGFIVLPPSVHPETGNAYEWVTAFSLPSGLPRFSPAWIYRRTRRRVARVADAADADFRERRAAGWLEKVEGAVSGDGGHNRTFRVACQLVLYFGLGREAALKLMRAWNLKCRPEWSEKELEHKVDDALKKRH